jgi:hypothetical protein
LNIFLSIVILIGFAIYIFDFRSKSTIEIDEEFLDNIKNKENQDKYNEKNIKQLKHDYSANTSSINILRGGSILSNHRNSMLLDQVGDNSMNNNISKVEKLREIYASNHIKSLQENDLEEYFEGAISPTKIRSHIVNQMKNIYSPKHIRTSNKKEEAVELDFEKLFERDKPRKMSTTKNVQTSIVEELQIKLNNDNKCNMEIEQKYSERNPNEENGISPRSKKKKCTIII